MASLEDVFETDSAPNPRLEAHQLLQKDPSSTQRQPSSSSASSSYQGAKAKKAAAEFLQVNRPQTYSSSSRNTQSSSSTRAENRAAQREVRTLPRKGSKIYEKNDPGLVTQLLTSGKAWIDSFEDHGDVSSRPTDRLLASPSRAHSAQHHYSPSNTARRMSQDGFVDNYDDAAHGVAEKKSDTGFFGGHRDPVKGRKWDHARNGDPVIMQSGIVPTSSPWQTFVKASTYGPGMTEDGERKNYNFLRQQTPGYEKPWRGDLEDNDDGPNTLVNLLHSKKRQRGFIKRLQNRMLTHPLIPLAFRLIMLTTSTIALALSGSIHHFSKKFKYPQSPSTTMAIVVDVIAIPYIIYITWDEYTGKPLGLRSPKAKIRLVLLDLFFIIFESANLALAFANSTDENGACREGTNGHNHVICGRVQALVSILMVALVAWSLTFSISIFRLVERVGGREETD